MRALALVLLCLALARAQDAEHYLWIMAGDRVLTASPHGQLRLEPAGQLATQSWRLVPLGEDRFRVTSEAFGGRRGLAFEEGRPVLAAGSGAVWSVADRGDGVCALEAEGRALSPADVVPGSPYGSWVLWPRRRLEAPPPAEGNYLRNDGADAWRVVVDRLEGRAEPDPKAAVVRVFARGDVLRFDPGRGGSDEIHWNAVDGEGNTWMRVVGGGWVRANERLLAPQR